MVAQATRQTGQRSTPAPQTLQNGAYTLGHTLCTLDARTLFAATQTGVNRPVLIERIAPIAAELAASAYVARQDVLSLGHVNIAQPIDIFVEQGVLYTAMCAGQGSPLLNRGPITQKQAVSYGVDICNALGYLQLNHHHLDAADISPCTIYITDANRARLTSMAALLGAHMPATASRFMAHTGEGEQATVFSLGATLYYALSGWKGAQHDKVTPALATASPECNKVLAKAMAADVTERYTSIAELRRALLSLQ
jgi:serine/threonine protein kinase